MRTDDALGFFDNDTKLLAKAIGLTRQAVESWGTDVPKSRRETVRMAMKERADNLKTEARRLERAAKAMEGK